MFVYSGLPGKLITFWHLYQCLWRSSYLIMCNAETGSIERRHFALVYNRDLTRNMSHSAWYTVESRSSFEPPMETKIGSKSRIGWDIGGRLQCSTEEKETTFGSSYREVKKKRVVIKRTHKRQMINCMLCLWWVCDVYMTTCLWKQDELIVSWDHIPGTCRIMYFFRRWNIHSLFSLYPLTRKWRPPAHFFEPFVRLEW